MAKLPEPQGQACWCVPLWPPSPSPFPKTGPLGKDSFMCFHPPFLITHFGCLLLFSSFLHRPTALSLFLRRSFYFTCSCKMMTFAGLPVNLEEAVFVQHHPKTVQQNKVTNLIAACSKAIYRPTTPLFVTPLVVPCVPVMMFDSIAGPGVSSGSCWVCGTPWAGCWEEESCNTHLARD